MLFLRQSTASQEILLGPFLDDTDGKTAETGLTIANTDIKLWKEGGTTESNKNSGGGTHIAGGRYSAVLDATDTDTLGKLEVNVHVAGALPVRREFMVLSTKMYDSLVLGTDNLEVDAIQLGGSTQSATDLKDFADAGYDPVTHHVTIVDVTSSVTDIASIGLQNIGVYVGNQLVFYRLDQLFKVDGDFDGAAPPAVGSWAQLTASKTPGGFTFTQTQDALEALADAIGVGGSVTIAAGGITAASFANNSITAAATATDFHTEVQASCNAALVALGLDDVMEIEEAITAALEAILSTHEGVAGSVAEAISLGFKIAQGDKYIETTTTPWQFVVIEKDSGTLLSGTRVLVQRLFNTSGVNLVSSSTVIGQAKE